MYILKIHNVARGEVHALVDKLSEALENTDEPVLNISLPLYDFYPPISFEIRSDKEGMK